MHPDEIRDIRSKEMDLKLKHRDLQKEYQKIAVKTMPEEERGPFVEHRVITLWQEAKKQDFSEEDLEAIRVCLLALLHLQILIYGLCLPVNTSDDALYTPFGTKSNTNTYVSPKLTNPLV